MQRQHLPRYHYQPDVTSDPTDDYVFIEAEQRLRSICSAENCQWPIAAWCVEDTCRAKLCLDHLSEHRNRHAREWQQRRCSDCGAGAETPGGLARHEAHGHALWICRDAVACAERTYQRYGGALYTHTEGVSGNDNG